MAEMNLGRIGFVAKGNFDPNKTDYKKLDQVTFEGSSFFARVNNPTGTPMVDNSNLDWQLSAKKGQDGYALGTIKPTDPEPTINGMYIPEVTQNEAGTPIVYPNAGGLTVNTAEGGEDYGMGVQLIKSGAVWAKSSYPLPMQDISGLATKEDFSSVEPVSNMMVRSTNLVNKSDLVGKIWIASSVPVDNTNRVSTPKIRIKPNTPYILKGFQPPAPTTRLAVFFDENGDYISGDIPGGMPGPTIFTSPENAHFIGINVENKTDAGLDPSNSEYAQTIMLAEGTDLNIPYEEYYIKIDPNSIKGGVVSYEDIAPITGALSSLSGQVNSLENFIEEVEKEYDIYYEFRESSFYDIGKTFNIVNDGDYFEIVSRTRNSDFNNTLSLLGSSSGGGANVFGYHHSLQEIRLREAGAGAQPWISFSAPGIIFGTFNRIRLSIVSGNYVLTVNGVPVDTPKAKTNGIDISIVGQSYGANHFYGDIKELTIHKEADGSTPEETYFQNFFSGAGATNVNEVIEKIPTEALIYPDFFYEVQPEGATGGHHKVIFYTKRKGAKKTYVGHEISHVIDTDELVYLNYWRNTGAWNYEYDGTSMNTLGTRALTPTENEFTFLIPGKADHTGGLHGDETTVSAVFEADGEEIDPAVEKGLTPCKNARYHVVSTMHNTADEGTPPVVDPTHEIVAEHTKTVVFGDGGYRIVNALIGKKSPNLPITRVYTALICNAKPQALEGYSEVSQKNDFSWTGVQTSEQNSNFTRETYFQNPETGLSSYITSRVMYPPEMDSQCSHFIAVRQADSKYYRHTPAFDLALNDVVIVEGIFECIGGE